MMARKRTQYTIRGVPDRVDHLLREKADHNKVSLNEAALEALSHGLGVEEAPVFHDLDDLAGTWVEDEEFDRAMDEQDRVDEDLWS
jgi:hypothetical protein